MGALPNPRIVPWFRLLEKMVPPQRKEAMNRRERQRENMQETTKKKIVNNDNSKKKERHIVTWTPEEDDILRKQISLHGTENWAIIASTFTDKSTRQCRRRWYTYLSSDFKRGGWSPEEDTLLCERYWRIKRIASFGNGKSSCSSCFWYFSSDQWRVPAPKAKRKTPYELREEQLKQTAFVDQAKEAFDALHPCKREDKPFCSEECRQEQIEKNEAKEKKTKLGYVYSSLLVVALDILMEFYYVQGFFLLNCSREFGTFFLIYGR